MEKYLRRCLDSLLIDEEGMKQLEVLVINDGSKDSSSQIAHEYQDKYPDTFRVIDKENGNYGSCVNRGLKEATGKYVKVLDADDWFDTEAFVQYLAYIQDITIDLILTPFNRRGNNNKLISFHQYELPLYKVITTKDFCVSENFEMHAFTYRTEMLKISHYVQTEGISYTDTEWVLLPLPYVTSVIYIPFCVYQYFVERSGQTIDPNVYLKRYEQLLKIYGRLIDVFSSMQMKGCEEYVNCKLHRSLLGLYRFVLINAKKIDINPLIDFDKSIRRTKVGHQLLNDDLDIRVKYKFIHDWRIHYNMNDINKIAIFIYKVIRKYRQIKR